MDSQRKEIDLVSEFLSEPACVLVVIPPPRLGGDNIKTSNLFGNA